MSTTTYVTYLIAGGVMAVLADMYFIMRRRWIRGERRRWIRSEETPSSVQEVPTPGVDVTGELTTGAKYAIWKYMFSILGIGGAVIGIVAGVAGYMINDLGKEEAIKVALSEMQKPLAEQLGVLADAKAGIAVVAKSITTDEFKAIVATKLSNDGAFQKSIGKELATTYAENLRGKPGKDGASPTVETVANELASKHVDQLRGAVGKDGKNGADGTSPNVATVADELAIKYGNQLRGAAGPAGKDGRDGKDGISPGVAEVAAILMSKYGDQIRGPAGAPGKDGASPDVNAVVGLLVRSHGDQLRGMQGLPGKDGKDGTSPSVDAVAKQLATRYELRGILGEPGKEGASPSADTVAGLIISKYRDQLRGAQGAPGKDGKDGASPSVEEVAATLASNHGDQLRQILAPRRQPHARTRRRRLHPVNLRHAQLFVWRRVVLLESLVLETRVDSGSVRQPEPAAASATSTAIRDDPPRRDATVSPRAV